MGMREEAAEERVGAIRRLSAPLLVGRTPRFRHTVLARGTYQHCYEASQSPSHSFEIMGASGLCADWGNSGGRQRHGRAF